MEAVREALCFVALLGGVLAAQPCGTQMTVNEHGRMPNTPYAGNGDLGAAVDGNGNCGEIQIDLGLNQMWMINQIKHWDGPEGDDVAPRRLGFGGVTIKTAPGQYSASMDMRNAQLRVRMGSLSMVLTLSEGEASGSTMAIQLNNTNGSTPLDVEVVSWVLPVGGLLCGHKHTPPQCNTMDGFTAVGAAAGTGSYAVRSPFKAWLYKPVMAALAVNAPTGSASTPTSCSANRTGADQWGGASCTYSLSAGGTLQLLASVVTNLDLCDTLEGCSDPLPAAQARVSNISAADVSAVVAVHKAWWQRFWSRSSISLPQSRDVEEFWATAQYLLGSSSRQGKVATGLWGPWVFTDNPGWEGDFTLDYSECRNTFLPLALLPCLLRACCIVDV